MHTLAAQYLGADRLCQQIAETQGEWIAPAEILAEEIGKGKLVYALGTGGHDNRSAEDLLWRAGGLASVAVILIPDFPLMHGATKATKIERLPGYAKGVLDYYQVGKDDTLLLVNSYGVNALTIDAVHACRERGTRVIAVTSFEFPQSLPPAIRLATPSSENLHEIVELAIDTAHPARRRRGGYPGFPLQGGRHLHPGQRLHPECPGMRRRGEAGAGGRGPTRVGQRECARRRRVEQATPGALSRSRPSPVGEPSPPLRPRARISGCSLLPTDAKPDRGLAVTRRGAGSSWRASGRGSSDRVNEEVGQRPAQDQQGPQGAIAVQPHDDSWGVARSDIQLSTEPDDPHDHPLDANQHGSHSRFGSTTGTEILLPQSDQERDENRGGSEVAW